MELIALTHHPCDSYDERENPIITANQNLTERQKQAWINAPGPVFVIGPAHSGKSATAPLFFDASDRVTVLGTGTPQDEGIARRIAWLQSQRPPHWQSLDAGPDPARLLIGLPQGGNVVIDSLSQWLGEVLVSAMAKYDQNQMAGHCDQESQALFAALGTLAPKKVLLFSTEMGCSPPPQRDWTRLYRQMVGELNQQAATYARSVFVATAGILTQVK